MSVLKIEKKASKDDVFQVTWNGRNTGEIKWYEHINSWAYRGLRDHQALTEQELLEIYEKVKELNNA